MSFYQAPPSALTRRPVDKEVEAECIPSKSHAIGKSSTGRADLSKADILNASLSGTLRSLAVIVVGVLVFSAIAWEYSTVSSCVSDGKVEVEKAIHITMSECDNPAYSQEYRERMMKTQQCEFARDLKNRGTFKVILECIFSQHFGAMGACKASPVCSEFVAWSDTFRKSFVFILIALCLVSLFGLKAMYHYERDGVEMLKGAFRGFWATRELDRGIPAPASDRKAL